MTAIIITQISRRPNSIANISVHNIIAGAIGDVTPTDNPTVPKADANSNKES